MSPHIRSEQPITSQSRLMSFDADESFTQPDFDDSSWTRFIPDSNAQFYVRSMFELDSNHFSILTGIRIEFYASYDVFINDRYLGSNGKPGTIKSQEVVGKLIKTFHVPEDYFVQGKNIVALKASNFHGQKKIRFFGMHIWKHIDLISNPILYTAFLQVFTGIFVILIGYFAFRYKHIRRRFACQLIAIAALWIFLFILEYIKFIYTYDYDWHFTRLKFILYGYCFVTMLTNFYLANVLSLPKKWMILIPYGLAFIYMMTSMFSYDWMSYNFISIMVGNALLMIAISWKNQKRQVLIHLISSINFLTIFIYLDVAVFLSAITFLIIQWVFQEKSQIQYNRELAKKMKEISVKTSKGLKTLEFANIRFIKGAKQYSEIHLTDHSMELYDQVLDKVLNQLPDDFHRVHKSYIINQNHVKEMSIKSGGKYHLILNDDMGIPVGRTYYKEIRNRLFPA